MARTRIAAAQTTEVSPDPCYLDAIIVSGGTIGNITVYDGPVAPENCLGVINSAYSGLMIPYGLHMERGLTIVTAAATDLLVVFYTRDQM